MLDLHDVRPSTARICLYVGPASKEQVDEAYAVKR
jgi:hypothetical protein